MEINNSFGEKRNVLFRIRGPVKSVNMSRPSATQYLDSTKLVSSLPPNLSASFYKDIYASPFEKVEGSISARFLDPLNEQSWGSNVSLSNTTSVSPEGNAKLTTRISCCEAPLDPAKVAATSLLSFLIRWTLPVTLTTPRIIYEAMRIEHLGLMKMMNKPVVQKGSVPRRATSIERCV